MKGGCGGAKTALGVVLTENNQFDLDFVFTNNDIPVSGPVSRPVSRLKTPRP